MKATLNFYGESMRYKHVDPQLKRYVVGDVSTRLYLQVAGRHPDLNRNKVDDAIDIVSERSRDLNRDGVPDEVQG